MPSILKDIFVRYRIVGWQLLFCLQHFKDVILLSSGLHVSDEKSVKPRICCLPVCNLLFFSGWFEVLKSVDFGSLIMMYIGVVFFVLICLNGLLSFLKSVNFCLWPNVENKICHYFFKYFFLPHSLSCGIHLPVC